jgi:hypothetical protein
VTFKIITMFSKGSSCILLYTENSGGTVAGRIQNLKPWPKGVSGNPKGRPKWDISAELARAVFENNAEAIYRAMARRLMKGDVRAFKILAERAYGKVKEHVDLELSVSGLAERLQAARQRMVEQETSSPGKELIERQPGIPNVSVKLLNSADNDVIPHRYRFAGWRG